MAPEHVQYLEGSERIVGYRTKIRRKPAFQITGYTVVVPPRNEAVMIPQFWTDVIASGGLDALARTSAVRPWILGLGSWDPQCQPGGQRYTIGVEETPETDLACLGTKYPLHTQRFEACEWMCFEMTSDQLWKDNPYTMLRKLGYRFHLRVGVHFDAYPDDYHPRTNPKVELWISVAKASARCDICDVREACAGMQRFD